MVKVPKTTGAETRKTWWLDSSIRAVWTQLGSRWRQIKLERLFKQWCLLCPWGEKSSQVSPAGAICRIFQACDLPHLPSVTSEWVKHWEACVLYISLPRSRHIDRHGKVYLDPRPTWGLERPNDWIYIVRSCLYVQSKSRHLYWTYMIKFGSIYKFCRK